MPIGYETTAEKYAYKLQIDHYTKEVLARKFKELGAITFTIHDLSVWFKEAKRFAKPKVLAQSLKRIGIEREDKKTGTNLSVYMLRYLGEVRESTKVEPRIRLVRMRGTDDYSKVIMRSDDSLQVLLNPDRTTNEPKEADTVWADIADVEEAGYVDI